MAESDSIALIALDVDGVLTDGSVSYTSDGDERKVISLRDVDAVFNARRHGFQVALVTGEDTPWVEFLSRRLQVEHTVRGAKDKLAAVRDLAQQVQVPMGEICYVGDGDRDAPALAAVGLGVAPADATVRAKAAACVVLRSSGGNGAVHEAISYLLERKGDIPEAGEQGGRAGVSSDGNGLDASVRRFRAIVDESIAIHRAMAQELASVVARVGDAIASALEDGHKLLIFGNGGSAADAQHFAAELVGRFMRERPALSAIALTTDTSVLTAVGNDYGMEFTFRRQIEALAKPGDIAVAISTSGNSRNVLEAVDAAKQVPIYTIGMTGKSGGALASMVDLCASVPTDVTPRIQDAHGLLIHAVSEIVEAKLAPDS